MTGRQSYDPHQLIEDVARLMTEHRLSPQRDQQGAKDRLIGACQLLRGLGVEALLSPDRGDAHDLDGHASYNARVHGD